MAEPNALQTALTEALRIHGGNVAAVARDVRLSQAAVGRWYSGLTKPDYESCLRLARVSGQPAAAVLRAAGHDPELLPVSADEDLPRVPLSVHQRSFEEQHRRWLEVMGPRMGEQAAEDLFWEDVKNHKAGQLRLVQTAINQDGNAAINPPVDNAGKKLRRGQNGSNGPLTRSKHDIGEGLLERTGSYVATLLNGRQPLMALAPTG